MAILKEYANHPSFVMLSFGNEGSNQDYSFANQLALQLKNQDATRMYATGSNTTFGNSDPLSNADYFTAQAYKNDPLRGTYGGMVGYINQSYPSTTFNYDSAAEKVNNYGVPVFSFEVGQYQVFPDLLTELSQYTGVLEPRNLQVVLEKTKEKGLTDEYITAAINATGMLSRLGYKAEIEAALRTENMSGISLLGIQDFPGQGTALVGMMNALGEPKPYDFSDPEEFQTFFNPKVVLLETPKFCYTEDENFTGNLLLSNYWQDDFSGEISCQLLTQDGQVFYEGKTAETLFKQGSLTEAGSISVPLDSITEPTKLTVQLTCGESHNSYNIWVYPKTEQSDGGDVYVASYLDGKALKTLEEGGKVLISPNVTSDTLPQSVVGNFTTSFWSSVFTSEDQPGTIGLLLDPKHPVFNEFPTDYYTDYQWWAMSKLGRPMILEDLTDKDGNRIEPLIRVIDGIGNLNNMGLLYEAKVGNGKLMVSSMGLEQLKGQYPEAQALRNSILNYMNSDEFDPQFEITADQINEQVKNAPRNVALKKNGGKPFLGENTETCLAGYDNLYPDRLDEINDDKANISSGIRSWTDWNGNVDYLYDAQIGIEFAETYEVDAVNFVFFEDFGCKVPASIKIQYWNGTEYADVKNQSTNSGFTVGENEIYFDGVRTNKLLFTMKHQERMGIAIAELMVYEKMEITQEDQAAIDAVIAAIDALPETVTLADEDAVTEAREAYESLNESQKRLVTNLSKLTAAEETIAELKKQASDQVKDQTAADAVIAAIDALPETITLEDEEAVTGAREAYESLNESQKRLVTNLAKLTSAEQQLDKLKGQQDNPSSTSDESSSYDEPSSNLNPPGSSDESSGSSYSDSPQTENSNSSPAAPNTIRDQETCPVTGEKYSKLLPVLLGVLAVSAVGAICLFLSNQKKKAKR